MDQANGAERPATVKELNQLQLDILEKLYESSARMEQKLNDFTESVSPRLAVLEALATRDRSDREESRTNNLGTKQVFWLAAGVTVAFFSSVGSLAISLIHVH